MQIQGRIAIVTGAASGIGRATAVALARSGAAGVALADLDEAGLEETARLLKDAGANPLAHTTDVADAGSLGALFAATTEQLGAFTILHNNAGLPTGVPVWPEQPVAKIETLLDVNLKGVVLGTRLALEPMQQAGGGVIVNTASIAAHTVLPPEAVYCASKAGVEMFTRCCEPLAESHGVRVAAVCPGIVETPMIRPDANDDVLPHVKPVYDRITPLQPEELAAAVIGLVEDDACAGRVIDVANRGRA